MNAVLRTLNLVVGALLLFVGIFMLPSPIDNVVRLVILISIAMIIFGIAEIVLFAMSKADKKPFWMLVSGIIAIIIGLGLLLGRNLLEGFSFIMPYFFSAWVIAGGVARGAGAFNAKKFGVPNWWVNLAIGGVGALIGVTLLFRPLFTAKVLGYLIAVVFIYEGITSILNYFINAK